MLINAIHFFHDQGLVCATVFQLPSYPLKRSYVKRRSLYAAAAVAAPFAVAAVAAHAAVALLQPKKISKKMRGKTVLISFFNRILKVTGNCPTSTQAPFYHVSKWVRPKNITTEVSN